MALKMHRIQVWSSEMDDRPGAAAAKLELLARADVNLEFVFTRPILGKPLSVAIFLAPIVGPDQAQAAQLAGLAPARDLCMLCVEGRNRTGIGFDIMSHLAIAGINLRGLSISAVADQFAAYLALDSADSVTQAVQVLANLDA
jgi:hypothetical protein